MPGPNKKPKDRPESMGGWAIGNPYEVDPHEAAEVMTDDTPDCVLDQLNDDMEF